MYSLFDYPPTICGYFEIATFYIPDLDAVGLVHRGFAGTTPIGLRFSQIADTVGGGKQVPGFQGIGLLYLWSKKLFQADGGWTRIVWMPSELKQRVLDAIPLELRDKIATEKEVTSIEELKKFLVEKGHPIVQKLRERERAEEKKKEKVEEKAPSITPTPPTPALPQAPQSAQSAAQPQAIATTMAPRVQTSLQAAGGITVSVTIPVPLLQQQQATQPTAVTLVLKGVKIRAEKVVIKRSSAGEGK
jgi:acetyl-CoA decarbonylase/synthase complex subunit beta